MPTNRKPRRRYVPRAIDPNPVDLAISCATTLSPQRQQETMAVAVQAFNAFRTGHGTEALWAQLADALNVAQALAELHIAGDHLGTTFAPAQQALAAVQARAGQPGGCYTLRGTEITALDDALFVHSIQLQHCSQGELRTAVANTVRRLHGALQGNPAPGTTLCMPALLASAQPPQPQPHHHAYTTPSRAAQ